jgi:hypothetical protein
MRRNFGRIIRHSTDDLRNVVRQKLRIARIDTFRREREQEIFVELQSLSSNIGSSTSSVVPG